MEYLPYKIHYGQKKMSSQIVLYDLGHHDQIKRVYLQILQLLKGLLIQENDAIH